MLFTIAYCTSFVLASLQCLCCTSCGIHISWMLHFYIESSIQISIIQNLWTYMNYHLLINTKSSLGKILRGKCFAAPIISHHLKIHFCSVDKAFCSLCSDSSFVFLQSFLRNWMEFELYVEKWENIWMQGYDIPFYFVDSSIHNRYKVHICYYIHYAMIERCKVNWLWSLEWLHHRSAW
jgi:hypothetical protein